MLYLHVLSFLNLILLYKYFDHLDMSKKFEWILHIHSQLGGRFIDSSIGSKDFWIVIGRDHLLLHIMKGKFPMGSAKCLVFRKQQKMLWPSHKPFSTGQCWGIANGVRQIRYCAFRMTHCISNLQGAIQSLILQLQSGVQIRDIWLQDASQ